MTLETAVKLCHRSEGYIFRIMMVRPQIGRDFYHQTK